MVEHFVFNFHSWECSDRFTTLMGEGLTQPQSVLSYKQINNNKKNSNKGKIG